LYARLGTEIHFDVRDFNVKFYKNVTELENLLRDRLNAIRASEQQLSEEKANLRRALYSEIISLASSIGSRVTNEECQCGFGQIDYLKNSDRGEVTAPLSFPVYEALKADPVAFNQLEEASRIDLVDDRLRVADTSLLLFERTSFDSIELASKKCAAMVGAYTTALSAIDAAFDLHKHILWDLDDGRFFEQWNALKKGKRISVSETY
jgi:hypothetical protein